MSSVMNGDVVEQLAAEMGIKFQRSRDPNHELAIDASTRDPDIVYLIDPKDSSEWNYDHSHYKQRDAIIYYKQRVQTLRWGEQTKATIRKIMMGGGSDCGCGLCFQDWAIGE